MFQLDCDARRNSAYQIMFCSKLFLETASTEQCRWFFTQGYSTGLNGFKLTGKIPIKSQMRYNSLTMCNVDPWAPNLYTVFTLLKFALNATP